MRPSKPETVYTMALDIDMMSRGSQLTPEELRSIYLDGRVSSRLTEILTSRVYDNAPAEANQKGVDGKGTRDAKYEYKTLRRGGTEFRLSKNSGYGRTCSYRDVDDFLKSVDAVFVTDITGFPKYRFVRLRASVLLDWHRTGILSEKGKIGYKAFWRAIEELPDFKREAEATWAYIYPR
jgi:hypothetical protein